MSRFNQKQNSYTHNLAGGQAYKESQELRLVSLLLTSFAQEQYYRSESETNEQLANLIKECDKEFVAKALIYARTQHGMRTITHIGTVELSKYISKYPWAKLFYSAIIHRVDDMTEIMACYLNGRSKKTKKIPNAMKKGFAHAISKFDEYQLAKYRAESKNVSLVDVVNLVHPRPNDVNKEALKKLVNGTLTVNQTWETKLTQAGQKASDEQEKVTLKKEAWGSLLSEKKLGYFALLKNLRNIIKQAPEYLNDACDMLVNDNLIQKSLVLPFRFLTAINELQKEDCPQAILSTLNKAIEKSLKNVPKFDGKTLIVLDESGSMEGKPFDIGSIFAISLYKSNDSDLMLFSNDGRYLILNRDDSLLTLSNSLKPVYSGTDFNCIFYQANKKYDRIVLLSDMQAWIGYYVPRQAFNDYKRRYNADPIVYSFDLTGYGSIQFPEKNVYCLAGFSEKVFSVMSLLESDKKAILKAIEEIKL